MATCAPDLLGLGKGQAAVEGVTTRATIGIPHLRLWSSSLGKSATTNPITECEGVRKDNPTRDTWPLVLGSSHDSLLTGKGTVS